MIEKKVARIIIPMTQSMIDNIDRMRGSELPIVSRSETIRRILEDALNANATKKIERTK